MQDEIYPKLDPAVRIAREYLTAKVADPARLDDFAAELRKLVVPTEKREALVSVYVERENNTGRMSLDRAEELRAKTLLYSAGHVGRMRQWVRDWLERLRGASATGDERIDELMNVLSRALGG